MFTVNKANLDHLKISIQTYGPHWLHGDGNIYLVRHDETDRIHPSDFHKGFSNPAPDQKAPSAAYRIRFDSVSQVPDDLDVLEKMMLEASHTESKLADQKASVPANVVRVAGSQPAVSSKPDELKAKDEEIAKLRAELEAAKAPKTQDELIDEAIAKEQAAKKK